MSESILVYWFKTMALDILVAGYVIIGALFSIDKAQASVKIGRLTTATYKVIFIKGLTQYLMHWKPN